MGSLALWAGSQAPSPLPLSLGTALFKELSAGQQGNTQLPPPLLCLVDAHLQSPFRFVLYGTEKSPGSGENGDLHTGLQDAEGELRGPGFCILLENAFRKQKQGQKRIVFYQEDTPILSP